MFDQGQAEQANALTAAVWRGICPACQQLPVSIAATLYVASPVELALLLLLLPLAPVSVHIKNLHVQQG
jgi:hypothetical protein